MKMGLNFLLHQSLLLLLFSHIRTTTTTAFGTRERKVERHGMARHAPFDGFTRVRRFRSRKFSLLLANEERSVQSSRGEEKRETKRLGVPVRGGALNVTHELTKLLDVDGIIRNGSVDETLRVDKCVVGFLELVRRRRTTSSSNNNNDNDSSINGGSSFRRKEAFVAAFHELYCDAFEILDREWLLAEATYMEFPKVLERTIRVKTREKLERFAKKRGPT